LVEIARFSPRKVQKRGFFAGGRGDFLAGQKRGFLGSRESRASGAASCEFRSQSLTPAMAASQHFNVKTNVNCPSECSTNALETQTIFVS
jgi:hypothetical protein